MAQQTAIEDLIISLVKFAEIDGVCPDTISAAIEFAENRKEMEEEQIKDAFLNGQTMEFNYQHHKGGHITGEDYYNETYKTQAHDKQQS